MKRKRKKLMYAGMLFLLAVLLCVPAAKVQAKAPKLNQKKLTMTVGQKKTLKVKNTKEKVTWKSAKPGIVKVSKKGVLTAKKAGKAVVKAKVGGKTLKCTVTVKKESGKAPQKKDDSAQKREENEKKDDSAQKNDENEKKDDSAQKSDGNEKKDDGAQKKDEEENPVDDSGYKSGECRMEDGVCYIRTYGYDETVQYPRGTLICSREQMQKYYQENRKSYALEGSFKETIDSFDDTYFEKNQLAVLLLATGSGSNRYRVVTGYYDEAKKEYQVMVELLRPGEGMAGTCEMAQWHILIPIADKIPEESTVTVTVTEGTEENSF